MVRNRNVTRVFAKLSNLIYPRRCPICDGITGKWDRLICENCKTIPQPVEEPVCKRCGKPLSIEESEFCPDCGRKNHLFEKGRAAFVYDSVMRASISRFKYHNRREYADFYADELLKRYGRTLRSWQPDALIPVPLHKSRLRRRGFNQAALVADRMGERLGIPVEKKLLLRVKKTRPQKELSDAERRENLKNAFQVCGNDVKLKRAVLLDDIYTTGSTLDAAASALRAAGVEKVYFLSICIGRGF